MKTPSVESQESRNFTGVRPNYGLTPREVEVLAIAAQGLDRSQIAERLGLRVLTVGTHLKKIHRKLGVHNRTGAVAKFYQQKCAHCGGALNAGTE